MTAYHQIGLIGAGRVAQAFALALAPHSAAPPLLWARSSDKAQAVAARIGRAVAAPRVESLLAAADLLVLAVSDDAVAAVAADLATALPAGHAPFAFHVSGRSGAAILAPLQAAGAATAAIHPAMTFTGDPPAEVRRMAQARFAITGATDAATQQAARLVALLGGIAVEIAEERRALYHAGLCHASNHLVTLIAGAAHALTDAGVDDPAALLAPLVRAALENSLGRGFAALSGPLLRGDARTIGEHVETLAANTPDLLPAYRAMALATLDELDRLAPSDARRALRPALDSTRAVP
ncbi:DUF2520 domain-containing protein [Sphingopyxis panaciterrulae]|uniref:Putative short-subunit dehydrogenase-like oxidoreductase (DUF2520 family) n=1 Tax=Sphingopyxis panaciterrulae TaxID=462372 RepID=A0A7W9B4Z3_9SPHN|nr:DUF2520 domain-containing protein [Sphingopyxis panaciterrulae]MBB5706056.1 putative short-subunit dehydrogenase-like oxidoreductase (DUF2520 family) [Sphingopyxis panaciterrulae]